MIRLLQEVEAASVASMAYLSVLGLVVDNKIWSSKEDLWKVGSVILATRWDEGLVLLASPKGEVVDLLCGAPSALEQIDSVSSYEFKWSGGFISDSVVALETSESLSVFDVGASKIKNEIAVEPCFDSMASDNGVLAVFGCGAVEFRIFEGSGIHVSRQVSYPFKDLIDRVVLTEGYGLVFCRDGKLARFGFAESITETAAVPNLPGRCLDAVRLESGFVRTIWSSGWVVDLDMFLHEALRQQVSDQAIFRAAIRPDGREVSCWDGQSVLRYEIQI